MAVLFAREARKCHLGLVPRSHPLKMKVSQLYTIESILSSKEAVHGGERECEKAQSLSFRSVLSLQIRSHGKAG